MVVLRQLKVEHKKLELIKVNYLTISPYIVILGKCDELENLGYICIATG